MAVNISGNGAIEGITSFNGEDIASFNEGGPTFRNILFNGWVNTSIGINQRGKTIAQVSNGEYWADRWQRVSSTTMTQKVEGGNYIPNRTYTLSGNNVTTTQITSPASGTWDWGTVPSNASLVQLELGDTASSFEYRPYGLEVILCQRYYEVVDCEYGTTAVLDAGNSNKAIKKPWIYKVSKRIIPTAIVTAQSGAYSTNASVSGIRSSFCNLNWQWQQTSGNFDRTKAAVVNVDAEL
ncbi:tail fiber protein [Synechococcus phage S-CAM7]|uniref:Uncharacterized protein n=1 Tax=Synechococcus phage S-CAM7 TaxID=1883368 RepID=A0A1D8KUF1_9CAUD|nr:tail fiber protein [Synechococcus phage S-CAM7]AOV62045.1 hypothetical protein C490910_121 [Synechococcus phage S-CAM7]AOV62308.1 hypothetical protein S420910_119 [Synechococcus phage S-CAM7]QLF86170.1 hypothetical protein CC030809_00114 [Synechococcus phage S-CAM7]